MAEDSRRRRHPIGRVAGTQGQAVKRPSERPTRRPPKNEEVSKTSGVREKVQQRGAVEEEVTADLSKDPRRED